MARDAKEASDRAECAFIDRCSGLDLDILSTAPWEKASDSEDRYEAKKLKKKAKSSIVNDGKLFKRGG